MSEIVASYVVVGGGIAGVSCAETLCQLSADSKDSVLLVSGSTLVRVAANVEQLTQTLVQFDVQEKSASELQEKTPGLQVLTGVTVQCLDPKNKQLQLADGRIIKYEKNVCICTGASPRQLPGSESCADRILTLRDVESVNSLEERLKHAKKVVVVGNGGIATELVYKLRGVQEVCWVVRDKHISAAFVDPGAAQFFLSSGALTAGKEPPPVIKRLRYSGATGEHSCMGAALGPDWHSKFTIQGPSGEAKPAITVEYETEVQQVLQQQGNSEYPASESRWPLSLHLTSGKVIECDLVVAATGVVPNCETFKDIVDLAPLTEMGGGIRVDKAMRTSVPGVFAAGDVVCASWPREKHWFQMRLWTQARQMGCQAARAMAAPDTAAMFDFSFEMFAHVTNFFGYKVVLLGLHNGQGMPRDSWEALVRVTPGKEYIKLVLAEGRVHGAVLVGDTELEETCENLILNQTDVSHLGDDLLNPDVDIEDYFD